VCASPTSAQVELILHEDDAVRDWSKLENMAFFSTATCFSNTGTFAELLVRVGQYVRQRRKELRQEALAANEAATATGDPPPEADPDVYLDEDKVPFVLFLDNLCIHDQLICK